MELYPILIWWLVILIFGLVGWTLAFGLLRHLPDRGFAFARPLGLLITGYVLWLGGTFRLLQNNIGGIVVALAAVLALGLIWQRQQLRSGSLSMLVWLRREWRYVLSVELLFTIAFIGWTLFKAYNPNIETAGGEKWMEITFINGTLHSSYFPPQDPWLSGFAISYYYFGYVLMAMVTRLTGLVSTTAFNLFVPTLFALTLTAAFGIIANLVSLYQTATRPDPTLPPSHLPTLLAEPELQTLYEQEEAFRSSNLPIFQPSNSPALQSSAILTGLVAALFVAVLGNLEGLLEVLHKAALLPAGFWTWLDIRDLKVPPTGPGDSWIPDRFIWWWRGSRVLTDYTLTGYEQEVIDEFPFFSFLLGDVHPHVLALPFVLLVIALALNLISKQRPVVRGQKSVASSQRSEASDELEIEELAHQSPAISSQPSATGHELSAVSGQWAVVVVDKVWAVLQSTWSELLEATGGRAAFLLYAICLGGLSFLNTWDFPIYLSVVGLAFMVWLASLEKDEGGRMKAETFILHPSSLILRGIVGTGVLGLVGILLYLPFYVTFQSQARGMLPNLWNPTRLPQFFVFFGPFLVAVMALLAVLSARHRTWRKYLGSTLMITILGPVLVMLLALTGVLLSPAGRDYVQGFLNDPAVQQVLGDATVSSLVQAALWRRLVNPWTFIFVGGLLGWVLALFVGGLEGWKVGRLEKSGAGIALSEETERPKLFGGRRSAVGSQLIVEQFVLILVLVGLALPLAVEFVYLRDNFGTRMNTIFKFYFQAWVLLALASAFAVYYVSHHLRGGLRLVWQVGMALLVAGGLVYPVLAVPNKADFFKNEPTLNAIAWIAAYHPGDYAAIEWLRANAPGQAVILEAPGAPAGQYGAYNYSGRISAMTGLPTLLGWGGHQSQWRGNYDEPGRREPDIALLYNSSDIRQTQALLDKYGITYVIVGATERERYSPQGLQKFEQFMDVAFQQGDTTIYQRR
ncbi:MAG: hypothetical protein BroJett011_19840 [Chloroflexota bacterium]|nr:MAG: hypothetical protein BroJett011_19840 [Chloroflexota bacterium]